MRLTIANEKAIRYACLNFHYAKAVPTNTFGMNVYNDKDEWCGVVLYGSGANNHIGSPYGLSQGEVVELVRVALNGKQPCTSQVVAASLKFVKEHCPLVRLIVSYADCDQKHIGTIYQATNWIYTGLTDKGDSYFIIHGKKVHRRTVHSKKVKLNGVIRPCPESLWAVKKYFDPNAEYFYTKGKQKYLMPLDKKMRKQILPLAKPYPKEDGFEKASRTEHAERMKEKLMNDR